MGFLKLPEFKDIFDKKINDFFENLDLENYLKNPLFYYIENGGKRLRPWIIHNFGQIVSANKKNLMEIAIAVEILHSSSLIHDDLPALDNAKLRRGGLANHLKFGEYKALLAGDYGFTLPLQIVANLDNINEGNKLLLMDYFIKTILKLFQGEMEDLIFEKENREVGEKEILGMYSKKTGAVFGFCFACPFLMTGEVQLAKEMNIIGTDFGVSFQIFDDLKDLFTTEEEIGKETNKDINKKTLLNFYNFQETQIIADNIYRSVLQKLEELNLKELSKIL
ncbi:MAG: polyprenyl synthetase family protein, partial [Thermotogota bacterium]|nr:polyprenyl synthetase family protein [Thermotogota bacterium]